MNSEKHLAPGALDMRLQAYNNIIIIINIIIINSERLEKMLHALHQCLPRPQTLVRPFPITPDLTPFFLDAPEQVTSFLSIS